MSKKKNGNSKMESSKPNNKLRLETKYGIYSVIAFALALFFILSAFNQGGLAGRFFYNIFNYLFGLGYFLWPIIFIILGASFLKSKKTNIGLIHSTGGALLFLSCLGLIDIINKKSGGVVGQWISFPFLTLFDVYVAILFLVAILFISIMLLFDIRPDFKLILNWLKNIFSQRRQNKVLEAEIKGLQGIDQPIEKSNPDVGLNPKDPYFAPASPELRRASEATQSEQLLISNKEEEKKEKKIKKDQDNSVGQIENWELEIGNSGTYTPPPIELLERDSGKPNVGDIKANSNIIKRTLANFGILVEMDEVTVGPSVTRYALKPAEGVKLSRILSLKNDLSLALAAHPLRIEAPIPGKSLVGIEVPNKSKSTVGLATLLGDKTFLEVLKPLMVALGKNIAGQAHFGSLAKMPHMLIAGATGAGKSVTIHSLITSLLYKNGPEALRFIMIDPKRVELTLYNGIPHLLTPTITDPKKAILSLKWATKEMEKRYSILEAEKVRDISSYHNKLASKLSKSSRGSEESESSLPRGSEATLRGEASETSQTRGVNLDKMPYIVIVIDELADIMSTYPRELESGIVRLAQMARAVGIHLILSTQRPSVNVITGLIKANIPARVALQVASQIDSRTILDSAGAEALLGAGDMLYLSGEMSQPERLQSAYISEEEVKKVVKFISKNNQSLDEILPEIEILSNDSGKNSENSLGLSLENDDEEDDELYEDARESVIQAGKASTSYLQRKLKLGYSRAARLMDMLEERGVIGPGEGAKPREVLVKPSNNMGQSIDNQEDLSRI